MLINAYTSKSLESWKICTTNCALAAHPYQSKRLPGCAHDRIAIADLSPLEISERYIVARVLPEFSNNGDTGTVFSFVLKCAFTIDRYYNEAVDVRSNVSSVLFSVPFWFWYSVSMVRILRLRIFEICFCSLLTNSI